VALEISMNKRQKKKLAKLQRHQPREDAVEPNRGEGNTENEKQTGEAIMTTLTQVDPSPGKGRKPECRYEPPPKWKSVAEVVGIVFAIFYAIVTFFQWRDLRNNFRTDERAWVFLHNRPDMDKPSTFAPIKMERGTPLIYPVRISNHGKTAAQNVVAKAFIDVLDARQEPNLGFVDDPDIHGPQRYEQGITSPGGWMDWDFQRPGRMIDDKEFVGVGQGSAYVVIFGIISYDDIFGNHHWTKFCSWLTPAPGAYSTRSCTAFNSVDKD
jgi:hypothetical protein